MKGLEGVKVVDLTGYVAGPACSRLLGELGARVIKIEPFSGDEQRTQGVGWGLPEKTEFDDVCYDMSSMNKEWMSINLKSDKGRELMYTLIGDSDILVTSFRDGALARLGMDYETIHEKFPHVVWAQLRGYGERGPEKNSRGYDATAYASRGAVVMSFPQKGEGFAPANMPAAFGDWNAGAILATGVLAALVRRMKTGEGDKVTVNLYHCAVYAMTAAVTARQQGTEFPKSRKEVPCPTNNCYRTKDDVWFLMCQGNYNKYFADIMTAAGLERLIGNKEYDTLEAVTANGKRNDVTRMLEEAFAKEDYSFWEKRFREREIPFQKCFTVDDVLGDREAYDNDILRRIHYDALGDYSVPTTPVRLKSIGDPVLHRSRPIGYDTAKIMKLYGYSEKEIRQMCRDGEVKCYEGDPLPPGVLSPSYGIDAGG